MHEGVSAMGWKHHLSATTAVLCYIVVLALVPAGPALAADDAEYAKAMHFRESSGLKSDASTVEQSLVDRQRYSNRDWGVPLTKAEGAEIWRRVKLADDAAQAIAYAESRPSYAGMKFDQHAEGIPIFWFTDNVAAHRDAIAERLPPGTSFEVRTADRTLADLTATKERIASDIHDLLDQGVPISKVGFDIVHNRVSIGLSRGDDGATQLLRDRYGQSVAIEVIGGITTDTCVSRTNCGDPPSEPWKGGIKIHATDEGPDAICTSGFISRKGNNLVILTAGHCFRPPMAASASRGSITTTSSATLRARRGIPAVQTTRSTSGGWTS
jgi:hypothetical protein